VHFLVKESICARFLAVMKYAFGEKMIDYFEINILQQQKQYVIDNNTTAAL